MIPDFNDKESVFVYKVHHSLADGLASVMMFTHLTDTPQKEDYPNVMVRFGWLQDMFIKLTLPVTLLWQTIG